MPSSTADARKTLVLGAGLVLAVCATVPAPLFTGAALVNAQGDPVDEASCPGGGDPPTPTAVAVGAVPIVVASTTADYFVLYVSHHLSGSTVDIPVLVKRGEAGTTTLAENVAALPVERYRVEKYPIADPADIDGDCIDDLTELDNLGSMNPVSSAAALPLHDGAITIPDRVTFEALAHSVDSLKFSVFGVDTGSPAHLFPERQHPRVPSLLSYLPSVPWASRRKRATTPTSLATSPTTRNSLLLMAVWASTPWSFSTQRPSAMWTSSIR